MNMVILGYRTRDELFRKSNVKKKTTNRMDMRDSAFERYTLVVYQDFFF